MGKQRFITIFTYTKISKMLRHADTLLGNNHEINNCTTAVSKWWLRKQARIELQQRKDLLCVVCAEAPWAGQVGEWVGLVGLSASQWENCCGSVTVSCCWWLRLRAVWEPRERGTSAFGSRYQATASIRLRTPRVSYTYLWGTVLYCSCGL
jgi:hypothetical protein